MSTLVRDPWADAYQVATAKDLDAEVTAVRRRLWARRAAGLALGVAALTAAYFLINRLIDPDAPELWRVSALWPGYSLMGLGIVLTFVGAARTSGASRPFVGPDAFLSRADRAWLRTQIAENRPVATERHAVAAATARRMVTEGRFLPGYLGLAAVYAGVIVGTPFAPMVITFSALMVYLGVQAVREAVWAHRARRWLAQND